MLHSWIYYSMDWRNDRKRDLVVVQNQSKVSEYDQVLNTIVNKNSDYYQNVLKKKEKSQDKIDTWSTDNRTKYWKKFSSQTPSPVVRF